MIRNISRQDPEKDEEGSVKDGELWEKGTAWLYRAVPREGREYAPRAFLLVAVAGLATFGTFLVAAVALGRFIARWDAIAPWIALGLGVLGVACLVGFVLAQRFSLALLASTLMAVALGIGIGPEPGPVLWVAAGFAVAALIAMLAVLYQGLRVVNEVTEAQAARAREEALENLGKADTLSARIAANQKVRALWEDMARKQASSSYTYSQIALAAGLLVLLVGSVAVFLSGDFASQAVIGGLAAIGGAISGFIARTYLVVYRDAQQQLNFYFVEPLVTSYLLTAERLAEKVKEEGESAGRGDAQLADRFQLAQKMYHEIATSVLRTSGESVWVAVGRRETPPANVEQTGEAS